jgi:hypothetical protein
VRDERKLLEKMNYIMNNPVKAGLAKTPANYKWLYWEGMEENHRQDACATKGR